MKVSVKREIVRRFKAGESIYDVAWLVQPAVVGTLGSRSAIVQQVLRDAMNGKFSMNPKSKLTDCIWIGAFKAPKKRRKA